MERRKLRIPDSVPMPIFTVKYIKMRPLPHFQPWSKRRSDMAVTDPAFKIIPKGQACFFIWRIENLQVVPVPRESHGTFFKGDAYIVLSARDTKGALDMHAHFWIGSESSQDEQGVAAYKTVELDDYLGGAPVQHRETEGAESSLFLSYFKKKGGLTKLRACGRIHFFYTQYYTQVG